jgi:LSD1 subclass zinc finger protein
MNTWKRFAKTLLTVAALAMLLVTPGAASAQCAMCGTAFNSAEGQRVLSAYKRGVLFLVTVPFLTFGTVAVVAVRKHRRLLALEELEDRD